MNKRGFFWKIVGLLIILVIVAVLFFASEIITKFTFSDNSLLNSTILNTEVPNSTVVNASISKNNNTEEIIVNESSQVHFSNSTNKSYIIQEVP